MSHAVTTPSDLVAPAAHLRVNYPQLRDANITLAPGTGRGVANLMLGAGVVGLALVVVGGFTGGADSFRWLHAIAAYHFATLAALAATLGALFFCLVFQLTNAGWTATLRRQYENVAGIVPIVAVMALIGIAIDFFVGKGHQTQLFAWLHPSVQDNVVLGKKKAFLNPSFFVIRAAVYVLVWTYLSRRMARLSLEQDRTGDRTLTAKARFTASWGILVFALSVAFAGFDWLMSSDFSFYSTMWGVYFFAGGAYAGAAVMILVFAGLRRTGRLEGVVTREHFHDMGKLLFAFTVFWAYIAFSQYFLIWYSNIPEETAFMNARVEGGWLGVTAFLCVAHFGLPFLILLFRGVKKSMPLAGAMAVWALLAHFTDHFWITRPNVYSRLGGTVADTVGWGAIWIDLAAIVGVVGVVGSLIVRKVCSGPLVAVNDPRIDEGLAHRNYV